MPDGGIQNLEKVLNDISAELPKVNDRVKQVAEQVNLEIKNLGKIQDETKATADKLLSQQGEMEARLNAAEQKLARGGGGTPERAKSLGEVVAGDESVKGFVTQAGKGKVQVNVKRSQLAVHNAITSVTTDTDGAAGDLVAPQRQVGIITPPQRRMTIRDLLTPGATQSNAIEYTKETGFTNAAAIATEGQIKPESTMKFDLLTTSVVTIAHWVKASKQILADAAMLRSHIDGRLRYGLAYKEEEQLLMGSGTSGNLNGIYTQATAFVAPFAPQAQSMIDTIRLAILQATLAEYPVDGLVLNPIDWARIELTKDQENRYIVANPLAMLGPTLWSRPVVDTPAMTVDKFLTTARMGAQIFDREDAAVVLSTEDGDNFTRNMVTILCEARLGLAVYRPESFIKGDFGNVT